MKFFLDQEFHSYFVPHPVIDGKEVHIIELISIGLVADNGNQFYSISNEFDVEAAWDDEWLRNNVLKTVWHQLRALNVNGNEENDFDLIMPFNLTSMQQLLRWHAATEEQIKQALLMFIEENSDGDPIEFYGYYADYDWVLFCSLFGRMIDLPKGFPMYCRDLKQTLDEIAQRILTAALTFPIFGEQPTLEDTINGIKRKEDYPKNEEEHDAGADAVWNRKLYHFLKNRYVR